MLEKFEVIPLELVDHTDKRADVTIEGQTLIRRTVLPGGVTVITERVPATSSAEIGCWFPVGSRDEIPCLYGATHFLEHLLFKGTTKRSAQQIAHSFDAVGGETNAATAKEYTAYYAKVLKEDLPMATEVLLDMVTNSTIAPEEYLVEKQVIIDELAMGLDDLNEVVYENFASKIFFEHDLGRPIGGTYETIGKVERESVIEHYRQHYHSNKMVVAVAGNVNHEQMCDMVMKHLQANGWDTTSAVAPHRRQKTHKEIKMSVGEHFIPKDSQQNHILVGTQGLNISDPRAIVMTVLNTALGGATSSRLFQEIREKRGLAYTTYAFDTVYSDNGIFGMYAGCNSSSTRQVIELMRQQLHDIADNGLSEFELQMTLGHLKGTTIMASEENSARMNRIAKSELLHGRYIPLEENIKRLQSITNQDVQQIAQYLTEKPEVVAVLGQEN